MNVTFVYTNNMNSELISVSDAANRLGKQRPHIFKLIRRLGIATVLEKHSEARGQRIAYLSPDDYDRIEEYFVNGEERIETTTAQPDVGGIFYLIQLEPEHDPGRFKLGFATNIEERLRSHKTAAPFAKLLKAWPCKLLWEKTAIDCVAQNCERLHTEVFRTSSITDVQTRCDQFFSLMPLVNSK